MFACGNLSVLGEKQSFDIWGEAVVLRFPVFAISKAALSLPGAAEADLTETLG
jgi:hypothetical protein